MKVNMGINVVKIFGQRLVEVEQTLNILELHTLEEIKSTWNNLEGNK